MTREDVLAMEPGSTLDSLVAEKVMGWMIDDEAFCPSSYISDAWQVIEEIQGRYGYVIQRNGDILNDEDLLEVGIGMSGYVRARTAPEAICKAALLAVMDA